MQQYLKFLQRIMRDGHFREDRTGTGTLSVFDHTMTFDLNKGFPLLTTKKIHTKSVIHELLWFLRGDTNIKYLNDNGVTIWNEWADEKGDLGPVYGKQWRAWIDSEGNEIDQIASVINEIKTNPCSRRLLVNAYNVADISKMALPPCHCFFQFYVSEGRLSCKLVQRSADAFLGVPFNIASYSFLTHMVAQQCQLTPDKFIWSGGDCHIYTNHIDQVKLQCQRKPKVLPTLELRPAQDIFSYQFEDFKIINYHPDPAIQGEIAV